MLVVGAGFAGLIAATKFPQAQVLEASPEPFESHRALLRFRSAAIGDMVGIPFRPVVMRRSIWISGEHHKANIRLANLYAQKVLGILRGDRSIWAETEGTRWIAPEDFYERLVARVGDRIEWGVKFDFDTDGEPTVNTAPLPVATAMCGIRMRSEFRRAPIHVRRYRLPPGTDAYQSVYFPTPAHGLYRASITKDLLICEYVADPDEDAERAALAQREVFDAFALPAHDVEAIDAVNQKYGKIAPISEAERTRAIWTLTARHNVFSLGRFATWRNILLDDLVKDIDVVRHLVEASDYERVLARRTTQQENE